MNREIKLSAMNCHHRFYTLESFFANAKANGYSCVELWTGPQHFYMDYHGYETIAKLKDLEHRYGIKIIGICLNRRIQNPIIWRSEIQICNCRLNIISRMLLMLR